MNTAIERTFSPVIKRNCSKHGILKLEPPEHSLEQYSASLKMLPIIPNVAYHRSHRTNAIVPIQSRLDFLNEHVQPVRPIVKQNIESLSMLNRVISTVKA